eukprot:scaffold80015_cov60-Phaeocystis_antarctica.AAC.1
MRDQAAHHRHRPPHRHEAREAGGAPAPDAQRTEAHRHRHYGGAGEVLHPRDRLEVHRVQGERTWEKGHRSGWPSATLGVISSAREQGAAEHPQSSEGVVDEAEQREVGRVAPLEHKLDRLGPHLAVCMQCVLCVYAVRKQCARSARAVACQGLVCCTAPRPSPAVGPAWSTRCRRRACGRDSR